jgi:hypothetical protein
VYYNTQYSEVKTSAAPPSFCRHFEAGPNLWRRTADTRLRPIPFNALLFQHWHQVCTRTVALSHHYSGPDYGFPHGDARLDLTDLYAFGKHGDPAKSILIMNFHPSVGINPAGPTTTESFAPRAVYELKIDTDGDAVADIAYRVTFSSEGGMQTATVRRVDGELAAGIGNGGQTIVEGAPVSMGREARVTEAGDFRFFAGWRSDPFFFDAEGAVNNLQFTGVDFFTEKDVWSIVLELPNSALGSRKVALWQRTVDGANGTWVQADRGALPSQSIFRTGEHRAEYLAAEPKDDARCQYSVAGRPFLRPHASRILSG